MKTVKQEQFGPSLERALAWGVGLGAVFLAVGLVAKQLRDRDLLPAAQSNAWSPRSQTRRRVLP